MPSVERLLTERCDRRTEIRVLLQKRYMAPTYYIGGGNSWEEDKDGSDGVLKQSFAVQGEHKREYRMRQSGSNSQRRGRGEGSNGEGTVNEKYQYGVWIW